MGRWLVMALLGVALLTGVVMSLNLERQIDEKEHLDKAETPETKSIAESPYDTWQGLCADPEVFDHCFARARTGLTGETGAWGALVISRADPRLRLQVIRELGRDAEEAAPANKLAGAELQVKGLPSLHLTECTEIMCTTEAARDIDVLAKAMMAADQVELVFHEDGGGKESAMLPLRDFSRAYLRVVRTPAK